MNFNKNFNRLVISMILILSFTWIGEVHAQDTWETLSKVTFKTEYDEAEEYEISYPIFSPTLQELDGQEVTLKGYMIPLEQMLGHNFFVLSMFPFSTCFFCGGAGPETVIEVNTRKPIRYTSKAVTIKGKLKLNDVDPDHLMFLLNDAVQLD